jgi:transposase
MREARMRRVIGIDIHRTFGEVVIWERGVLRHAGRVDMTRTALEGFGKTLEATDEVVIEATGNSMAAARVLSPFVARVVIANPLQVDREIALSVMQDASVRRLMTITGVNLTVAVGVMAAIGDIARFESPQKLVSYFGLNPRVRQSGLGAAHHGRISKVGRSHARAILVEAAWAAAKAPGPLHAFFVRIRAKRGHQVAAVALARKLTVLCWHLLTRQEDYLWARPALVAKKTRDMELRAGLPQKKGNRRGPAYAYNVKDLRQQESVLARHAERTYEQFVARWKRSKPTALPGAGSPETGSR